MKHLFTLFLLCGLLSSPTLRAQTIRRCNNNPGISGPNVYTSIQAAHDAAVNGDIIYVEPSLYHYGNLTCSKRLTIIGNGFFLPENSDDSFDSRKSEIQTATFTTGSANSRITGINFTFLSNVTVMDANLVFNRCTIAYTLLSYVGLQGPTGIVVSSAGDNTTFTSCYVYAGIAGSSVPGSPSSRFINGLSVKNCIISNNTGNPLFSSVNNSVIVNNTLNATSNQAAIQSVTGSTISSNIFRIGSNTVLSNDVGSQGNSVANNLSVIDNTTAPHIFFNTSGLNNQENVSLQTVFVVPNPFSPTPASDINFRLSTNSPARGAGVGGTDAGAFGGTTPYVLAGQPNVPIITNFTTSGAATPNTPLTVTVSVRSNN